jgi:hypothetical protein
MELLHSFRYVLVLLLLLFVVASVWVTVRDRN